MNTVCSWCGRSTEVQHIEVHDDEGSEHPTGAVPVCQECLDALKGE